MLITNQYLHFTVFTKMYFTKVEVTKDVFTKNVFTKVDN